MHRYLSLLLVSVTAVFSLPSQAAVRYVKSNASGSSHDGASWQTAFLTVQAGVSASAPGDEVWVAGGTYTENITLKSGVALYGGFLGFETNRAQRDSKNNSTVLDG